MWWVSQAVAGLLFEAARDMAPMEQVCDGFRGCYTHKVYLVDLDQDADLDAAFASGGGYYEPDAAHPLMAWRNDGGVFVDVSEAWFAGWSGRVRQLALGDVDGDGDVDLIAPDGYGMAPDAVFLRTEAGWQEDGAARLGTRSRAGASRLGDVDGDGDLDLFVSDWGEAPPSSPGLGHLYLNDGAGRFVERPDALPAADQTARRGTGPIDADLLDADGDWDLDLLIASREGDSLMLWNDGTGRFVHDVGFPRQPGPYVYGPDACDVDGDHDLDIWLDNGGADLTEQLLLNTGDGEFADGTVGIEGNPGADDNEVRCVDVDSDGDMDAVIASISDAERVLLNDGAGRFTLREPSFTPLVDPTLGIDLGDIDGDGRLDAVTAQGEGRDWREKTWRGTEIAPDDRPPTVRAIRPPRPGDTSLLVAVTEQTDTDLGPRLASAILRGAGGERALRWVGGDLLRADVPLEEGASWQLCLTDLAGNQGCTDLTVEPEAVVDTDVTPEPPAPEDEVVPELPEDTDEGGCGCEAARSSTGLVSGLLLLVVGLRRRGR